jgi:hypothetical protein
MQQNISDVFYDAWHFTTESLIGYKDNGTTEGSHIFRDSGKMSSGESMLYLLMDANPKISSGIFIDITNTNVDTSDDMHALRIRVPATTSSAMATQEVIAIEGAGATSPYNDVNKTVFMVDRTGAVLVNPRRPESVTTSHYGFRFDGRHQVTGGNYLPASDNWNPFQIFIPPAASDSSSGVGEYDDDDYFILCSKGTNAAPVRKFSVRHNGAVEGLSFNGECDLASKSNVAYQNTTTQKSMASGITYYGLDKINGINTATYNLAGESQLRVGLIAQDIQGAMPNVAYTDADGTRRVDIMGLCATLINAVRELSDRMEAMEARHGM